MSTWRVARSLLQLREQVDARWPGRPTASDGTIGNAEHASRESDHNPWYGPGIVTAMDLTHDPASADMRVLSRELVASRDRRIKYLIWDRRILSGAAGPAPWTWRPYGGTNAHTRHMHISVVASPACDDTSRWALFTLPSPPRPIEEDPMPTPAELWQYQIVNPVSKAPATAADRLLDVQRDVDELLVRLVRIESALARLSPPAAR